MKKPGSTRIILLSLAGGGMLAGFLWFIVNEIQRPDFSPPDKLREWARIDFRETFAPVPALPLPTLTESPVPALNVTIKANQLTIEFAEHKSPETRDQHEIFAPDGKGEVNLPGGNRLRLEAFALVQNADIDWGEKRYKDDHPVEWLDPVTLNPLPAETTDGWPKPHLRQNNPSSLLLRVSNSGEAPLRWFGATAYDDRTHAKASGSSSWGASSQHNIFNLELLIWHQTPLRIAVDFAFGDPEFRDLELKPESEVRFGDDAQIRVIHMAPMRNGSSSWSSGLSEFNFVPASAGRDPEKSVIFQLWPPHNQYLVDFTATADDGATRRHTVSGNSGLCTINYGREFIDVSTFQVRRFPKLGRAVFELPQLPGLPEVTNLLETPIPRATFFYGNELRHFIEKSAELKWSAWRLKNVPDRAFPMTLENTTPLEALRIWEELVGEPLFLDDETLSLLDEKPAPSGWIARSIQWWKKTKPSWLP